METWNPLSATVYREMFNAHIFGVGAEVSSTIGDVLFGRSKRHLRKVRVAEARLQVVEGGVLEGRRFTHVWLQALRVTIQSRCVHCLRHRSEEFRVDCIAAPTKPVSQDATQLDNSKVQIRCLQGWQYVDVMMTCATFLSAYTHPPASQCGLSHVKRICRVNSQCSSASAEHELRYPCYARPLMLKFG